MGNTVRVRVDTYTGRISRYTIIGYINPLTYTSPFTFERGARALGYEGAVDCEVVEEETGKHIRDSIVDLRGNVSDVAPNPDTSIDRHESRRLRVGWGNIFGTDLSLPDYLRVPIAIEQLCSVGSMCVIGSNVTLSTEKGFHIGDLAQIEDQVTVLGHLKMGYDAVLRKGVKITSSGVVVVGDYGIVGDGSWIYGYLEVGDQAVTSRLIVNKKESVDIPSGYDPESD